MCHSRPAETADHIVPLSRGGTNDIENLRPACGPCNFSRGNRASWFDLLSEGEQTATQDATP
ncbi:HNH endonuclease [Streptomyces sp. NPDC094468]|uniref:HNH endonuclease n=1 Tax=Streptomyces sp. NPDC094468 TaxID=3366066 RepID=UPI0038085385